MALPIADALEHAVNTAPGAPAVNAAQVVTDWLCSEDVYKELLVIVTRNMGKTGSHSAVRRIVSALTDTPEVYRNEDVKT